MSFISGLYFRGDPKQKPKQWGPAAVVTRALFNNAEKIGIDPSIISFVLPCWGPGDQHSLGNIHRIGQNTGVEYNRGGLYFQKDGKYVTFANDGKLEYDRITVLSYAMHVGTPTYEHRVMSMDSTSTSRRSWQLDLASTISNTNPRFLIFSSGAAKSASVSTSVTINTPHLIGGSFGGGEIKCYYDDKIATTSYSGSIDKTGSPLFLGVSGSDLYQKFYGYLYWCLMLSDIVPDSIIKKLYNNPYYLFQQPEFHTYFGLETSGVPITDTPDLTDIISYPILGSETATGLDSGSSPDVISSPLPGIDSCTALDMACIANATGLSINAFDQAFAFDYPAFANALGVPIECILGNILYDSAQLTNAVGVITQASGIAMANDTCHATPIAAYALVNTGYAVALDASVMGLANGYVIPGEETGVLTDVAELAHASATAIAVMIGNSMLDAAMLAQAGVMILAADETAIANGYGAMITVPSVVLVSDAQAAAVETPVLAVATGWVLPGVEVMSVADYAALAASQGATVSAFETLVLTDPSAITLVNAWMLTAATATDHDINAIFGTPVLVPVLSGRPVLQNKLQGTPLIIRS